MDVQRLCNAYIPAWLASAGMDASKISQFYDDPEKCGNDASSQRQAYDLRSISIDTGLPWHVRRWVRFLHRFGVGALRHVRETLSVRRTAQP